MPDPSVSDQRALEVAVFGCLKRAPRAEQLHVRGMRQHETSDLIRGNPTQLVVLIGRVIYDCPGVVDEPNTHVDGSGGIRHLFEGRSERRLKVNGEFLAQFLRERLGRRLSMLNVPAR